MYILRTLYILYFFLYIYSVQTLKKLFSKKRIFCKKLNDFFILK